MEFINIIDLASTQTTGWHSILSYCTIAVSEIVSFSFSVIFSLRATMLINLNLYFESSCHTFPVFLPASSGRAVPRVHVHLGHAV